MTNFRTYLSYHVELNPLVYEQSDSQVRQLFHLLHLDSDNLYKEREMEKHIGLVEHYQIRDLLNNGKIVLFPDTHPRREHDGRPYPRELWPLNHGLTYTPIVHFDADYDYLALRVINIAREMHLDKSRENISEPAIYLDDVTAGKFLLVKDELRIRADKT